MKKNIPYGALLAAIFCVSLSCSSRTLKVKDTRPITKQPQASTQAVLFAIQTIPGKTPHSFIGLLKKCKGHFAALLGLLWLWLLTRFYTNEKSLRIPRWTLDDLACLKLIKDTATRLWHRRLGKNVIHLNDWRA